MGIPGTRKGSPLAGDCLFMFATAAITMVYITISSSMSTNIALKKAVVVSRQGVSNSRDIISLVSLPDQPDRMVLLLLSIVASNTVMSQAVNAAIISCFSEVSEEETKNWGAYRLERFTPRLVQVEYFVLTSEQASLVAPEKIDEYIRTGNLTKCVRESNVGFPVSGSLLGGRTVIATDVGSMVSSQGNIAGWTIGVVIGCVAVIGGIIVMVLWCKGERVYKEEDYETYEDDENGEEGEGEASESDDGDLLRSMRVEDTMAGQHRRTITYRV